MVSAIMNFKIVTCLFINYLAISLLNKLNKYLVNIIRLRANFLFPVVFFFSDDCTLCLYDTYLKYVTELRL